MSCADCQKTKAPLSCGLCAKSLCKSCTQFLEEESFSFYLSLPAVLRHQSYCLQCFSQSVQPELDRYEELMVQAREILVFEKSQSKETRLIRRDENPVRVNDCIDRDEAVLRLAFQTVQKGYNAIIDMDLVGKKVIRDGYQKTYWSGTAIPTQVSENKLLKDRSLRSNPN